MISTNVFYFFKEDFMYNYITDYYIFSIVYIFIVYVYLITII